jgi:hypothetical protein
VGQEALLGLALNGFGDLRPARVRIENPTLLHGSMHTFDADV